MCSTRTHAADHQQGSSRWENRKEQTKIHAHGMECRFIQTRSIKSMTGTHTHWANHHLWLLDSLFPPGIQASNIQTYKNALWNKLDLILPLTLKYERKELWNQVHWANVFTTLWPIHRKHWGSLTSTEHLFVHILFHKFTGERMMWTLPAWGIYLGPLILRIYMLVVL